jgi:hypothetical protein
MSRGKIARNDVKLFIEQSRTDCYAYYVNHVYLDTSVRNIVYSLNPDYVKNHYRPADEIDYILHSDLIDHFISVYNKQK